MDHRALREAHSEIAQAAKVVMYPSPEGDEELIGAGRRLADIVELKMASLETCVKLNKGHRFHSFADSHRLYCRRCGMVHDADG